MNEKCFFCRHELAANLDNMTCVCGADYFLSAVDNALNVLFELEDYEIQAEIKNIAIVFRDGRKIVEMPPVPFTNDHVSYRELLKSKFDKLMIFL